MKAVGEFMYKDLEKREKGKFTDRETGEVIEYNECFTVVCDELGEKIKERRFRFDKNNTTLASMFDNIESYSMVKITFDVTVYSSNCKLTPTSVEVVQKK